MRLPGSGINFLLLLPHLFLLLLPHLLLLPYLFLMRLHLSHERVDRCSLVAHGQSQEPIYVAPREFRYVFECDEVRRLGVSHAKYIFI